MTPDPVVEAVERLRRTVQHIAATVVVLAVLTVIVLTIRSHRHAQQRKDRHIQCVADEIVGHFDQDCQ